MTPKIHSRIWDDLIDQSTEVKTAALWIMTNSTLNYTGYCRYAPSRFKFETGLTVSWLDEALRQLPRMFLRVGELILILEFIGEQYGTGEKLAANHIAKGVAREIPNLPPEFQAEIYRRYPQMISVLEALQRASKGLASPSKGLEALREPLLPISDRQALAKPFQGDTKPLPSPSETNNDAGANGVGNFRPSEIPSKIGSPSKPLPSPSKGKGEGEGEGEGEGDRRGSGGTIHGPTDGDELETKVGNGEVQLRYDFAKEVLADLNQKSGADFRENQGVLLPIAMRLHAVGNDLPAVKKMVARQCQLWREDPHMRTFLRPITLFGDKFPEYFGQRNLPAEAAGPRLTAAQLRELIDSSPANPQSTYHSHDASDEERAQLKKWRAELAAATKR